MAEAFRLSVAAASRTLQGLLEFALPLEFAMSEEMKAPATDPAGQPPPLQIPIDVSKMESIYCNFFRLSLSSSTEEVLMDIGMHTGILASANSVEPIHLTHRVVLNPYVAKRLLQSLQQIVARHEQAFGALELDPQRRLRPGARPGA